MMANSRDPSSGRGWGTLLKLEMSSWFSTMGGLGGFSKDFVELIKAIGEAKSKEEEDRIIQRELKALKAFLPTLESEKRMKELIVRLMYCEMLGHDASFGYIHAINMTQAQKLLDKRVGYLAVATFLHERHPLTVLLISSLQRDLSSSNHLEVCAALNAVNRIITADTIPAILNHVVKLLNHQKEIVRKKAALALHHFFLHDPSLIEAQLDTIRRILYDKDPSVMGASLVLFQALIRRNRRSFRDLTLSFVSILKQVIEHRLPAGYDYDKVPSPWLQIALMRILALLGADDQNASENMYEVLGEAMRRADLSTNAGFCVAYEAVSTITTIYPHPPTLDAAARLLYSFLQPGTTHNIKYLGIKALAEMVSLNPKYALEHQLVVVDCLEDRDDVIRRKTLELLYAMTNSKNVTLIVDKFLQYLVQHAARFASGDDHDLRAALVPRLTTLIERFAPSNEWYIETMHKVFLLAGDIVAPPVAHNLLRLVAEGNGDDVADKRLRMYAVATCLQSLSMATANDTAAPLPRVLIEVIAWVLGEYAVEYCAVWTANKQPEHGLDRITEQLCALFDRAAENTLVVSTRPWIVTALLKITAQREGRRSRRVDTLLTTFSSSHDLDLAQRCREFSELLRATPSLLSRVLPVDASCEDIHADSRLSPVDSFVQTALLAGAKPHRGGGQPVVLSFPFMEVSRRSPAGHRRGNSVKRNAGLKFAYEAVTPASTDTGQSPPRVAPPAVGSHSIFDLPNRSVDTVSTPAVNEHRSVSTQEPTTSGLIVRGISQKWRRPQPPPPATTTPAPNGSSAGATVASPPRSGGPQSTETPPRAKTQREIEAEMLFGAFDTDTAASAKRPLSIAPPRGRGGPLSTAPTAGGPPMGERRNTPPQSLSETSLPLPAVSTSTPKTPPSSGEALFDFEEDQSASASSAKHPSAPPLLLLDLEIPPISTNPSAPRSTGVYTTERTAAVSKPPMSAFGFPLDDDSGSEQSANSSLLVPQKVLFGIPNAGADLSSLPLSPTIEAKYGSAAGYERSPGPISVLYQQPNAFHFGNCRLYGSEQTAIVLFMSNVSDLPIAALRLAFDTVPDELAVRLDADPGVDVVDNAGDARMLVRVGHLPAKTTVLAVVLLRFRRHALSAMPIGGKLSYSLGSDTRHAAFVVAVETGDLLRPATTMTTKEFAGLWKTHRQEKRLRITSRTIDSAAAYVVALRGRGVNLHAVEVIGSEVIACGRLLPAVDSTTAAGGPQMVLVHAKVTPLPPSGTDGSQTTVDLIVRSKDVVFTEAVARYLQRVLI